MTNFILIKEFGALASANIWGLTPISPSKGSDPNWLALVSLRRFRARPSGDWFAEHCAVEAANDMAWRAVA